MFDYLQGCKKTATSKTTEETRRESNHKTNKATLHNKVIDVMNNDRLTAREIAMRLFRDGIIDYPARSIIQPRITELVKDKRLVVSGKKYDKKSNRNVAVYEKAEVENDK